MIKKVLLLMLSAGGIFAQSKVVPFEREILDNGMEVIYSIDKSAPVVTVVVHYKVGSKDEDQNRTGFAHFFEHLMFEATNEIERAKITEYINEVGGDLNAYTSFDETVYHSTVPSNQIKLPLWIEASRMRGLKVENIGVETQRGVVKEERRNRYENQPYGDAFERICKELFIGSQYEWTPIGSMEHLNKAAVAEFQNFYNTYYQPNNAILSICGDINIDSAKKYVRDYFGAFEKTAPIIRRKNLVADLKSEKNIEIEDAKAQVPAMFIVYKAPNFSDDDYYAFSLLRSIISAGESSRIYRTLVDKLELASAASMDIENLENSGLAFFQFIPNNDVKPSKIKDEFDNLLEELIKKGIDDKELQKVKNIAEAQNINGLNMTVTKAVQLAHYQRYLGDPNYLNTEIKKLMDVKKSDLIKVAKKYLGEKNRLVLTYVPKK